jgi:hypothetical protein
MSSLTDSNTRQNGRDGNEVGTCFITSESYPDCNFLLSLVDLPTPSNGFTYSFRPSYSNGTLTYFYDSDPKASTSSLTTYVLPPYSCPESALTDGSLATITVVDTQAKTAPKTGQVSNIQFQGKFGLPHEVSRLNTQHKDTVAPTQADWYVNLFIINSATQTNQSFGIVTCPINENLDGYNGPYSEYLSIVLADSGNVSVTPNRLASAQAAIVAIGVAAAPLNVSFNNWQVWPGGAVTSSANTSGNYRENILSSNNPTTTL